MEPISIQQEKSITHALLCSFAGDAVALPVHWYYDIVKLKENYGNITTILESRKDKTHPDSWRYFTKINPKDKVKNPYDVFHEKAIYYQMQSNSDTAATSNDPLHHHYHPLCSKGSYTLTMQLSRELIRSLGECETYDAGDYTNKYLRKLLIPGEHDDLYVESAHRTFLYHLYHGFPLSDCGDENEGCLGGLVLCLPLLLLSSLEQSKQKCTESDEILEQNFKFPKKMELLKSMNDSKQDRSSNGEPQVSCYSGTSWIKTHFHDSIVTFKHKFYNEDVMENANVNGLETLALAHMRITHKADALRIACLELFNLFVKIHSCPDASRINQSIQHLEDTIHSLVEQNVCPIALTKTEVTENLIELRTKCNDIQCIEAISMFELFSNNALLTPSWSR